jgi:type III secretion protein J
MRNFRRANIVFVFIICIFCGCSVVVVSGIDEGEANKLLVVLAESNIKAGKKLIETEKGPKWNITVSRKNFLRALQILEENNLPGEKTEGVIEIFGKKDFLPTQTAERTLEEYSQNAELSKTIEQIQGVVKARVHVARTRDEFTGVEKPVSASVLINYIAGESGEQPFSADDIKRIVAGGVANLLEENVNVVAVPIRQKSIKSPASVSSISFVFFLSCGFFVLVAGGINIYFWNKLRSIKPLNNRIQNAVSDKRETESGN